MRSAPIVVLLTLVTACGGSSDPKELTDSGSKNLSAANFEAAVEDFDRALAAIGEDPANPLYLRARMGAIEARTQSEPERARADFLALSEALPDAVSDRHFSSVAGRLGDAGHFKEAIALLEAGKAVHPDSSTLDALGEKLAAQASQADDPAAVEALRGLGYVGE